MLSKSNSLRFARWLPAAVLLPGVLTLLFLSSVMDVAAAGLRRTSARSAEPVDFNRDVRPILSENCFACHGPDKNKRKAGLRLDRGEDAMAVLESGKRAVVPGDVTHSLLLQVVSTGDDSERMPPRKTGKRLTAEQIEVLRNWIAQGAPFKEHWAYLAPERPPLPEVRQRNWPRNEIDRFILQRLEKEGLKPSPEADRNTLIRRVTLDLTGLPPTRGEVDAFLADKSPAAYDKVVDRLLASQAFGERFAQQWLDLARYADSDGYHADAPRSMWQYRDYVIRSLNQNKPFNQFTLEQLAGDLLPNATLDQRIATAFNRNGMSSTEGGADPDEYMNKYVTDRVNTFGTVFLGSSTACTECHDHKYDPFTQKEYYQLYDFFNRIPERGLDSDPAPPFIKVPVPEQAASMAKLTQEVTLLERQRREVLDRSDESLSRAQAAWEAGHRRRIADGWQTLTPSAASASSGATLAILDDSSVLASGKLADKDVYEVGGETSLTSVDAFRLEVLPDKSLPAGGPGRSTNGIPAVTGFEVEAESLDPAKEPAVAEIQWGAWSAIGPFKAAAPKEIFEKAFIDEAQPDLKRTHDEGRQKWRALPDWKDGVPQPLSGENQVTYLHRTVTVKTARYIQITFGSDGGIQAWLNGTKVREGQVFRRVAPAPDEVMVLLQPGENHMLLKVHHGSGLYGFLFAPPKAPVTRHAVTFAAAVADSGNGEASAKAAIDGRVETGWVPERAPAGATAGHQILLVAQTPVHFAAGARLKIRIRSESAVPQRAPGRFRLSVAPPAGLAELAALPQPVVSALFTADSSLSTERRTALREYHRENFHPETRALNARLADARKAVKELDGRIPTLRVMEEMAQPRETHVRVRGDYRAKGEKVVADVPRILPPLPAGQSTNRLALAKWLVSPQHPLLGRVTVNRYWAMYFGTGLVKTGNEFGTQGELPSHPDLLDWLAREFMDGGWDIKAMQRRIVTSATYRQSSKPTPQLLERDPSNRLLARGPRIRLSAEVIRDCALDYAGLLDRSRVPGGPSVKPYQPAGLWEEKMFGGNTYQESKGEDLYRRSLYTLWKRTVLNPTLMTFDAPDRAICTEQRSVTCTPLQAFVTLNEKGFIEAARMLAERVVREGGTDTNSRIEYACKTVLARVPSPREARILAGVHADMMRSYQEDLKAALDLLSAGEVRREVRRNELDLAAWTAVANVLLNLDETITKE